MTRPQKRRQRPAKSPKEHATMIRTAMLQLDRILHSEDMYAIVAVVNTLAVLSERLKPSEPPAGL